MQPPIPSPLTAAAVLLCASLLASCAAGASDVREDAWGVRLLGQRLETLSDVNTGKPARVGTIEARVVAARQRKPMAVELHADLATATLLAASADDYAPELDKALDWMQRLRAGGRPPARIVLTLVDDTQRTKLRRVHDTTAGIVVDLVVALPADPASPSVEVGKAVAVALHEMSHALSAGLDAGRRPGRRDDEYRAAMVEACYRVDTLRTGDTLRLAPRKGAGVGEYFVTAQSRDAGRDVVADLVRAAGTATVHWFDEVALRGLKLACAVKVAQLP